MIKNHNCFHILQIIEGFNIVNVTKDILLTPTSVNVVIKSSQMAALVGVEEAARPDV